MVYRESGWDLDLDLGLGRWIGFGVEHSDGAQSLFMFCFLASVLVPYRRVAAVSVSIVRYHGYPVS